jgi:hypothetical protein
MNNPDAGLRNQVRAAMRLKETDELIEIYRKQDEDEWSDLAFEIVREILVERLGSLPADLARSSDDSDSDIDQLSLKQLLARLIEVQERQLWILEEMQERTGRWSIIVVLSIGIFLGLISTTIFLYLLTILFR